MHEVAFCKRSWIESAMEVSNTSLKLCLSLLWIYTCSTYYFGQDNAHQSSYLREILGLFRPPLLGRPNQRLHL